jgi:hypothetical protein
MRGLFVCKETDKNTAALIGCGKNYGKIIIDINGSGFKFHQLASLSK